MSSLFENKLVRRHTQHSLEEEAVSKGLWSRLTARLHSWKDRKSSGTGDVELNGGDTDSALQVDAREDLYRIMVSNRPPDKLLNRCWRWYLCYLDLQIKELWNSILVPLLQDLPSYPRASPSDMARIYMLIRIVASGISRGTERDAETEITLDNMADEIRTHLKEEADINLVRQLVWCVSGPLTMLFDPKIPISHGLLQLRRPASRQVARGRHRGTIITSFAQPTSAAEEPFYQMLTQFGALFPKVRQKSSKDTCCHASNHASGSHFYPSHISFDVLKTLANLNIEWVNTLNLHLQLDERKRILRVFRFPALCRLLYANGIDENGELNSEKSFLCQLFDHYNASQVQGQPQERDSLTFHDYLRDIILSYRILFGMKERSRKAFGDELKNWELDKGHDGPFSGQRLYEMDPLLRLLCTDAGQSPELKELLSSLGGEETSSRYSFDDFPFLGKRLRDLQSFMEGYKPTGFKLLWQDRRDAQNWWIIWTAGAVLLIGGGTIVLQFWQLVFQIMSTFYHNGGGS